MIPQYPMIGLVKMGNRVFPFSNIPMTGLLGRFFRNILRLIPKGTVMPILQGPIKGYKWVVGSHTHGCWLGSYELEKQKLFYQMVPVGGVVFDIGAHVGFYTLLSVEKVGSRGKVVSFEPLPRNLEILKKHLKMNHCDTRVTLIEDAVAKKNGSKFFEVSPLSAGGHLNDNEGLKIQTVSLDELFFNELVPQPDLIKMDIEGGEFDALLGANKLLSDHHPVIFLATHSCEIHRNCCKYLISIGYELIPINSNTIENTDELIAIRKVGFK